MVNPESSWLAGLTRGTTCSTCLNVELPTLLVTAPLHLGAVAVPGPPEIHHRGTEDTEDSSNGRDLQAVTATTTKNVLGFDGCHSAVVISPIRDSSVSSVPLWWIFL